MPAALLFPTIDVQINQDNQARSLQKLAAFEGEDVPETLDVSQWINQYSQYIEMTVKDGLTQYRFNDERAGGAAASDFGILAKMSCAAFNAQPEYSRRQTAGVGLPQLEDIRPAAGGEQARFTSYWWGGVIWCNHILCIDLENLFSGVAGPAAIAAALAALVPGAGHVIAVLCGALAAAAKLYLDAFKWADGKCQAANINFTWISPVTPWISQPC